MVERTSVSLLLKSSACEMGVGNLPAERRMDTIKMRVTGRKNKSTFGETRTEETGNLLDEGLGSKEGVVFLGELLDELFVFVEPELQLNCYPL